MVEMPRPQKFGPSISAKAIEMLEWISKLQPPEWNQHQVKHMQINDFWKEVPKIIILISSFLDPAFARTRNIIPQAIQAYKRLNLMAMYKLIKEVVFLWVSLVYK